MERKSLTRPIEAFDKRIFLCEVRGYEKPDKPYRYNMPLLVLGRSTEEALHDAVRKYRFHYPGMGQVYSAEAYLYIPLKPLPEPVRMYFQHLWSGMGHYREKRSGKRIEIGQFYVASALSDGLTSRSDSGFHFGISVPKRGRSPAVYSVVELHTELAGRMTLPYMATGHGRTHDAKPTIEIFRM